MQTELAPIPSRRPLSGSPDWCRLLAPAAEGGASQAHSARGDRILIVEDDLLVANQMEAALSDAGFDVAGTATTREEALQLAQAKSPTLVVMDIRLRGGADGIDTALDLFRLHGIRCIFASAHSDDEAQRRAAPAAPLGWLQKPYTMASLTAMVRAAVNQLRS